MPHSGKADDGKQTEVEPVHVELEPPRRETRGIWVGMMIVVQFLSTQSDPLGKNVPALVPDLGEVPFDHDKDQRFHHSVPQLPNSGFLAYSIRSAASRLLKNRGPSPPETGS